MVRAEEVKVIPYSLKLNYDHWTYYDIMSSILPEDEQEELPSSFSIVGHIAHLNLREQYLAFKSLIAAVLLDKNPSVTTVINKTNDVGTSSAYRTFGYEVLAGDSDLSVEVKEEGCTFRFDYAKVYWNSRLNTEHRRLVEIFRPGEAVCDIMAGVGPFAIPAAKKGVLVWANDLNPDSYNSLTDAIRRNNVSGIASVSTKEERDQD
ncbi:MAG: tRNA(m(1)G37)methyltransferase [Thelocarpon superellum]|nr:MAG: tRNA(m(1)G37)methyltransferase [Thelocarpon superellum]